jgi:acetyl/propionyl-CoA carboxylase alpha subunit
MRIAHSAKEFNETLEACRREATAAFGNGDVLVEK